MKKLRKAALLTAVFTAAFNLNACAYGPPPGEEEEFDPDVNVSATVYGPPVSMTENTAAPEDEEQTAEESDEEY